MRGFGRWYAVCFLLLGLLWFVPAGASAGEAAGDTAAEGKEPVVVCIGDGLTDAEWKTKQDSPVYSYLPPVEKHWTTLLAAGLPAKVVNQGIAGQRTDEMLARFQQDVLDLHPDICIIMAGTNDVLQGRPVPDAMRNIRRMAELCQQNHIRPVLANAPVMASGTQADFAALYAAHQQLAAEEHLVWVDLHQTLLQGEDGVNPVYTLSDRIHINAIGQSIVAQKMLEELRDMDAVPIEESSLSLSSWRALVQQYRSEGNTKRALRALDAAMAAYPDKAVLYADRARVYLDLSDVEKADADLQKALSLQPDCVDACLGLGIEYAGLGQMKKAREAFDRAAAIEPGNADVLSLRAKFYDLGIADFRTALADIDRAYELAPSEKKLEIGLRRLQVEQYTHVYTKEYDHKIIEDMTELLTLPGVTPELRVEVLYLRTSIYQQQKEYQKALLDNAALMKLCEGKTEQLAKILWNQGNILNAMGEETLALHAYQQARSLDPSIVLPRHYRKLVEGGSK